MLLIDGVKYEEWTPRKEVEEFHPLVKKHYKEIFGSNSLFIEGNRLESGSGKGSVPDGFVITTNEAPQWYIVEMELSTHQLYDHIVNQVGRFINGIKTTASQKKVIDSIYQYVQEDKRRKAEFEEAIGSGEIFKFISDLITKPPVLVVIIENRTQELDEALDLLKYSPIKIIEFQTFRRVGAEAIHAHLFEPLRVAEQRMERAVDKPGIIVVVKDRKPLMGSEVRVKVVPSALKYWLIPFASEYRHSFPGYDESFTLVTDIGEISTHITGARAGISVGDLDAGNRIQGNLTEWYRKHPELQPGDELVIRVIEPMKKYRLEIVK